MPGILLDKDGTLIDFDATWLPVYRSVVLHLAGGDEAWAEEMLVATGYDRELGRCRAGSTICVGTTMQMVPAWRPDLSGVELEDAIRHVDTMFTDGALDHITPITDLAALFTRLAQDGYRLGIATNDVTRSALACFDHFGLSGQLDFITGYDGVAEPKPAPDMVLAFCAACEIEPSHVVVVGDNVQDLEMGIAAGVRLTVGVLSGHADAQDFAACADIVLDTVADLPQALDRQRAL